MDPKSSKRLSFLISVVFFAVIIGLALLAFKYVVPLLVPFIIAAIVAWLLQPVVHLLEKSKHIGHKFASLLVVAVVSVGTGALCYWLINSLIREFGTLAANMSEFLDDMNNNPDMVSSLIKKIDSYIPFFDMTTELQEYWNNLDQNLLEAAKTILTNITNEILPFLTSTFSFLAQMLVITIIEFIALYYFTADFGKITAFITAQIPDNARSIGSSLKNELLKTVGLYLRAYGLIICITFAELVTTFLILDIKYAVIIALITSIVDILPILGIGTIMIPWGLFTIIVYGDVFTGVALLAAYLLITIIRQIIEPKIVGSYIGMYPLVTLIMIYVGLRVWGVIGLFLFPIATIIIKNMNDRGQIHLWKYPPDIEEEQKKQMQKVPLFARFFNSRVKKIEEQIEKKHTKSNEKKHGNDNDKK